MTMHSWQILSVVATWLLATECFAQDLTLGYEPKARANNDGAAVWTMIKAKGFTTDGVITGFNVYATISTQPSRPIVFGVYRPVANVTCKFTALKFWQAVITDANKITKITFSENEQFAFRAGDTVGYMWLHGGVIPFDTDTNYNYCDESLSQENTIVGDDVTLIANRHGNRIYSFQAVYKQVLGFSPLPRTITDTATLWTFVQKQGFSTNGVIKGFNVYTQFPTSSRPFTLGLYRPVSGKNCTYTLLKRWTPTITEANKVTELTFDAADQFAFQAGDAIGYTWTNVGGIPWDVDFKSNYCESNTQATTIGQEIVLNNNLGNRQYSFQAFF